MAENVLFAITNEIMRSHQLFSFPLFLAFSDSPYKLRFPKPFRFRKPSQVVGCVLRTIQTTCYFDLSVGVGGFGLSVGVDDFGDIAAAGGSGNSLKRRPILLPPASELSGMLNRGLFPISSSKSRKTFSNRWSSCQRAFALFIIELSGIKRLNLQTEKRSN
jgi:hypothetical protein